MERWKRKIKVNREGASFVSVVIGVLFMVAIGMTILTVANNYLTSVHVDENSADNFYQSEGILEEIRTGLLEKAGDAAKEAYVHSLEHYTSERKSVKETFAKNYFNGLITAIGGSPYGWEDKDIGKPMPCSLNIIQKLTKITKEPSPVKTKPGTSDLAYVINQTAEGSYTLTLKNLFIDYTDDAGYRSTVGADIVFHVPDYQFEGDTTFDVLKDYVSISDDSLFVNTPVDANAKAEVTGNVFAGKSIQVMEQRNVDFKCNTMISREDLEAKTGSEVNVTGESGLGEVWLRNIRLKSTGTGGDLSTKFSMNTNAYIANDLDIADNNSVVTLKGRYYGFSYNKENESTQPCNQADYSSAVLVNGVNTTLNASDLDKLVLAGRAFVAQKDSDGNAKESNIILGESISVKSNQIAYLVPDAYMPEDHNPVVIADVTEEFETSVKTRLLDSASPLRDYLNLEEPFSVNYNPNNYAYFFLNFSSEKKANQYFKDCYMDKITSTDEDGQRISDNAKLKENAKSYLMSTDMTNNRFSGNLYLLAGNAVYNYASTGNGGMQKANYYDDSGKPFKELVLDGKKKALNYLGKCLTLQDSGSEGRTAIRMKQEYDSSKTEDNMVYGGILSASALDSVTGQQSYHGGSIVVSPGNYTIGPEKTTGLIIAKGDVNVAADFTGLILAGGKVSIQSNCTLKSDMITIGKLLEAIDKDESLEEVKKLFTALNGKAKPATTKLEKCVTYQNWQKSE